MINRSLKLKLYLLIAMVFVFFAGGVIAKEAPPVPYRSAPLIPWAKKVDEHRFRSPRTFDRTLEYYRKTVLFSPMVVKVKIINNAEVRAVHLRNKKAGARWEGLNIYEYQGAAYIFVVLSDKELAKIAERKKRKAKKKRGQK